LARQRCDLVKSVLFIFTILAFALRSPGQTNEPVRVALVSESDEASAVVDVLTAEFSGHKNLQLLERNEIEKVYREQGLSAANTDYLKLGQILGADGLLLLDVVRTPQTTNLMARLIAVKPGVILTDGSFAWPLKDTAQWAESVSSYLNLLLPKLSVQAKDAIPISVVNLRSAVASAEGAETERQLKLLTIQRLSQEKELFVLERQKMQLLSEEKELKADDSAFWNGSYLLEGVVDQNGYSQETITINARLTPSKGGTPLMMEVSGSRTNLAAVVNQLALEVNKALKINSTAKEWNAADEAAQYFAEAQWALRWGSYVEAQAAADSAWALGKKDLAGALMRVKAYLAEVSPKAGEFQNGEATISSGYDANNRPLGPAPTGAAVQEEVNRILAQCPFGVVYRTHEDNGARVIDYRFAMQAPDPVNIDRAMHALELYYEFSRTSTNGQPKILWRGVGWNDWHNSDWYNLGIESLIAASKVLQGFNLIPASQVPVADKLRELRALARSVAGLISQSPSIHDSYFVGDRVATHDELIYTIGGENQNDSSIFNCEVAWGCLWQETPEDCVMLYRELMSSPVFCYIHSQFWQRQAAFNHVIGWNEEDNKRAFQVWNGFVQELNNSTNVLLRMEAKALLMTDAQNNEQAQSARNALFEIIRSNRAELVANNVELFYMGWGLDYLNAELNAMDQEYWNKTISARQTALAFEKQKQYLASFTPYDFQTFQQVFASRGFTKAQAAELLPLITAYKSNLFAQASSAPEKFKAQSAGQWIAISFEKQVNEILNPSAPLPAPAKLQTSKPIAIAKTVAPVPVATNAPVVVINVLTANKFLEIPLDGLPGDQISGVSISAHHWLEGKLLLDLQYGAQVYSFDTKSNWQSTRGATFPAIAILDPEGERWDVIGCPEMKIQEQRHFYHRSTLWHGQLFNSDGGQIKKYDFTGRQWQVLPVSDGGNYELFTVNDQLFAANGNMIFEIIDDGKSTRILASNRRNPPVSKLDTENLGTPTLFEGPGHSLRVCTKSKIFTWTGNDWHEDAAAPPFTLPPVISPAGVLFRTDGFNLPASISFLAIGTNVAEFDLGQKSRPINNVNVSRPEADKQSGPVWQLPSGLFLANLPAAQSKSNLYLWVDHSEVQDIVNEQQHVITGKKILPKDGYNAALLCFSRDVPSPQKVFFKFDDSDGCPPVTGINPDSRQVFPAAPPVWMLFTANFLICGLEKPDNFLPNGAENIGMGRKPGVWLLPAAQIAASLAGQKQTQLEQMAQAAMAAGQARKNLLARIDFNHNGIIDPDEREATLDDPAFIESELDAIDANHNGWLDAIELVYFDANNNKTLEPKEQAGIEIAQHLLAESLLKKYDASGDGALDRSEFNDLVQSIPGAIVRPTPNFPGQFPDDNHDGKIDQAELEVFVKQQLRQELRPRGAMGAAYFRQMITDPGKKVDVGQSFKAYVELFWQNSGSITNKPPAE
jgi:EF hand